MSPPGTLPDAAGGVTGIAIGAVARATGIPANTLRTWERRYGFPAPMRTDGGQRLYEPRIVAHLRLVARALELGHRPAQVLRAPVPQLRALVGEAPPAPPPELPVQGDAVASWLQWATELDAVSFEAGLSTECNRLGLGAFLDERVAPFLNALGEAWAAGKVTTYQEHHATERLRSFLSGRWRPLAAEARGPVALATTLPGERHDLGVHLVGSVLALEGWRPVFLGAETPVAEIVAAARQSEAAAVLVSISAFADREPARAALASLHARLAGIPILVGGAGAPSDLDGVTTLAGLDGLRAWLRGRAGSPP